MQDLFDLAEDNVRKKNWQTFPNGIMFVVSDVISSAVNIDFVVIDKAVLVRSFPL